MKVNLKLSSRSAFSLIEVTLAIGIVAFAVTALVGVISVGIETNRTSVNETAAMGILSALELDLRTSPSSVAGANPASPPVLSGTTAFFKIDRAKIGLQGIGGSKIFINTDGKLDQSGNDRRFRLIVENIAPLAAVVDNSVPYCCRAKVAWPGGAQVREDGSGTVESAQGSVEVFISVYPVHPTVP